MQHRQIDDDLKTMGSHSGTLGGPAGFVVGQVVDAKALQANTPYRLVPDSRTGENSGYQDQAQSAATDYLGLGSQFGSSEPLWQGAEAETAGSPHLQALRKTGGLPDAVPTAGTASAEAKRSSSPSRPYRSEAEKERAWLGMRNNTGRASPTGPGHGYGNISQQGASDGREGPERAVHEMHPQGRSMSVGGIGAMGRSGDVWSGQQGADRSRKMSMGQMTPSASSQGLTSSSSSSSSSSFGTIDEGSSGYGLPSSASTGTLPNGHINLPSAPGSSAMLDAARTSQSRRR